VPIKYQLKSRYQQIEEGLDAEAKKTLSVSELTRNIRLLLETSFSGVWVEGEVSNFKFHTSGHMYFSLKDDQAQIACVMFRRENASLGFELQDGMQVLCFARVSVYAPRGQYQLMIDRMEPKGVGALQLRFEALKEKLRLEGLFDQACKKAIPFLPARIAVVTSVDGAALRDILHVLGRRFADAHILIYPVPVQGLPAAPAIVEAIDDLNREALADVMIIGRGGGSLEDLWAFNEEAVARAIYRSVIPVISAVGHETDFTIADFVSDLRAPTPSAAAEIVLPLQEELSARIAELKIRSRQSITGRLKELRERLRELSSRRAIQDPLAVFEALFQRLDELNKGLATFFGHTVRLKREAAAFLTGKLEALGPLATLQRGFSVSLKYPEGTLIRSTRSVRAGETVKTKLKDGYFLSRVTEVERG
jgi:exodeoxyribonuclease VII large subunit